jgi:high-affinity Fe2+/Pb2+ permease
VYDLRLILPDDSSNVAGYLLRGVVGYTAAPTVLEVSAYVAYWIVLILVYLGIRTGKIAAVTDPLRRVWHRISRRGLQAHADVD